MFEKDQNVLVRPTVQTKKAIKDLEEYCISNSLPKPVFQREKLNNWEVLAKIGSYEAKGSNTKLSTAKRDAANFLLTQLKGLETETEKEKLSQENIQTTTKEQSIKILEDYCLSNSLPKPVFQDKLNVHWEVHAKVGSYEAKGTGKHSIAERDAAINLLIKLEQTKLETEIRTEKLMKDQNLLDTPNIKAKKSNKDIQQKIHQIQQQMQEQNSTENLKKVLGFESEACKEPNTQIPAKKSAENLNPSLIKKGSWIWIEGLQGAKDLNGKLGQIVKFNKDKQRYEVFIPDSNGFNSRDFLPAKSMLDKIHIPSQIEFIRKIFRQEDESSLIGKKIFPF